MSAMKRLLMGLLAGALAAVTAAPATAQQKSAPLFRVELVVFRATTPPTGEDWTAPPGFRGFNSDPSTQGGGSAPPSVIKIYPSESYELGGMASKLSASGAYRPIAHAAWLQTATPWGRHVGIDLAEVGIKSTELSGTIYLERGTLLHLGLDLRLGSDPTYRLSELRRIKFNEKHYFDHPAFGAIAIVSPVRSGDSTD
jgi:Peptidoglycan-binding protein, CsiV